MRRLQIMVLAVEVLALTSVTAGIALVSVPGACCFAGVAVIAAVERKAA